MDKTYIIPTVASQADLEIEAENLWDAIGKGIEYANNPDNDVVIDRSREPYALQSTVRPHQEPKKWVDYEQIPPPGEGPLADAVGKIQADDNKIYSTRKHKGAELNITNKELVLLAAIFRNRQHVVFREVDELDAETHRMVMAFIMFGMVVRHGIGGGKTGVHITAIGSFALNQAVALGWKEAGER